MMELDLTDKNKHENDVEASVCFAEAENSLSKFNEDKKSKELTQSFPSHVELITVRHKLKFNFETKAGSD